MWHYNIVIGMILVLSWCRSNLKFEKKRLHVLCLYLFEYFMIYIFNFSLIRLSLNVIRNVTTFKFIIVVRTEINLNKLSLV